MVSSNGDRATAAQVARDPAWRERFRDRVSGEGPVRALGQATGAVLVVAAIVLVSALLFSTGLALLAVLWRVIAWGFALAP